MTVEARHATHLPVVCGAVGGLIAVKSCCHWQILDDDLALISLTSTDPLVDVKLYADRCAELLERHGLIDAPENAEGLAT